MVARTNAYGAPIDPDRLGAHIATLIRRALTNFVYCTVCGAEIHWSGETQELWSKRRRCGACLKKNRTAAETKYCRLCGKPYTFAEYQAAHADEARVSHERGWATWARCDSCEAYMKGANSFALEVGRRARQLILKRPNARASI